MPHTNERIKIPFDDGSINLLAVTTMVLKPRTETTVIVKADLDRNTSITLDERQRWGTVTGLASNHNCKCRVANGLMRVEESNSNNHNWIMVMNPFDHDVVIQQGEHLAHFTQTNLEDATIIHLDETTSNKDPNAPTQDLLTGEALEAAWTSKPNIQHINVKPGNNLTNEQVIILKNLIIKHARLWDLQTKPIPDDATKCHIQLQTAEFTSQGRLPPMNPNTRKQLRSIIEDKLKRDIIEPSTAGCSSTVLLIPKPGSTKLRFCVDYRALNKVIKPDAYTLPAVEENLANMNGNRFFTSLDLKEAFWQVPLTQTSKELTSFRTPDGLYMYRRMPMGLKTASAVFCRFIDGIIGSLKDAHVLCYIDDLLVCTPTFEQHVSILDTLFTRLNKANLTLGAAKCHMAKSNVKFLGHIVGEDGIAPDPIKVKAIEALKLPNSQEELSQSLGIMGYYRKFVHNYSAVAAPLRAKKVGPKAAWRKDKDGRVPWTEEEKHAFEVLRDALTQEPILKHPDYAHPFELHTDASAKGLGAILCQRIDKKEHVISYASRAVAKHERHFSIWELECLAMVWAARLFSMYLTNTKFVIFTDSTAAKALLEANDAGAGGRLLRWRLALQEFEFDVKHRKGKQNGNADALSRNHIDDEDPYDQGPTEILPKSALNHIHNKDQLSTFYFDKTDAEAWTTQEWATLQQADASCEDIINHIKIDKTTQRRYFITKDGLLFKRSSSDTTKNKGTILVPASLRAFILGRYHSLPISGHKGRDKTRHAIKTKYYWKSMTRDIDRWVKACLVCAKRKAPRPLHSNNPASVCEATRRWQAIAIDLVEVGTTSTEQHKYILTCICLFTRYTIAVPIKSKKAKHVAEAIFTHIFAVHGKPESIRSDEGKEFVNAALTRLYRHWNIQPITTGGHRPWANPVERWHRFLNASMTTLSAKFGEDWSTYLQAVVFSYNSSTNRSTGFSPYFLMYGKEPALLEDVDIPYIHNQQPDDDIAHITKRLHDAYRLVHAQQKRIAEQNRACMQKLSKPITYEKDDQVLYWEPAQKKALHGEQDDTILLREAPGKWKPRWTGPHMVTAVHEGKYGKRYTIKHNGRKEPIEGVKADKLTPFTPWSNAMPSTAPDLDDNRTFRVGSWCPPGSMFILELERPWPFGMGKAITTHDDATITFQWYGAKGQQATTQWLPMWWTGSKSYRGTTKRKPTDVPFTGEHNNFPVTQSDLTLHSFKLTPAGNVPALVLHACSESPDIWWTQRKRKQINEQD